MDQAEAYIKDFTNSRIEVVPTVRGTLISQESLSKKQKIGFFLLKPCTGELIRFDKRDHYDKVIKEDMDWARAKSKFGVDCIDLRNVVSIYASFRGEFINKNQHCLEICFFNEQIQYVASYDSDNISQWLEYLTKAKKFFDWFTLLQEVLREEDKLTE